MNFEKAIDILNLEKNFTDKELKHAYYRNAIKYNPDKNNGSDDSSIIFKEINEAYTFLCDNKDLRKDDNINSDDVSFYNIINNCVKYMMPEVDLEKSTVNYIMEELLKKCKKVSYSIFENMSKEKSIELYALLSKNKEILSIDEEVLTEIVDIIKKKVESDNVIVLNPDINDLLDDKIYKLEYINKTYYIPLWHNEIVYDDSSGNDIIVNCIPDLSDNIFIDNNNNLHVKITDKLLNVFNKNKIEVSIGNKNFEIESYKLTIVKNQIYKLSNSGILNNDENDIFNDKKRKDIFFHITLE